VSTWTINDVADWARAIPDVLEEDITVLKNQRVNGSALVVLSYDKLVLEPFKLTGGVALQIETRAKQLTAITNPTLPVADVDFADYSKLIITSHNPSISRPFPGFFIGFQNIAEHLNILIARLKG
jgi:hypothetical protein